jgi:hypothetical protein
MCLNPTTGAVKMGDKMGEDIPPQFYEKLRIRVLSKVSKDRFGKGCWEWRGCMRKDGKYGRVSLNIRGDRMYVNAHRASYIAFTECFVLPNDISHCCHEKLCVNPDHLSHEEHCINRSRARCIEAGQCQGHGEHKPCIL